MSYIEKLQKLAESKGKIVLIESVNINPSEGIGEIVNHSKSPILFESENKQYKAFSVIRNVPVTRFIENANGRVYPRKLWEKIQKNSYAEGTHCLADHPGDDEDGSVKNIVGVWRNFRVMDEEGVGDLYLVGPHGRHLHEVLEAGGNAGMSSVGFGELQEDEKTVNPDTYELVRLADWVLFPSQGVYATQENLQEKSKSYTNKIEKEDNSYTILFETEYQKMNRGLSNMDVATEIMVKNIKNQSKHLIRESKNALISKDAKALHTSKSKLNEFLIDHSPFLAEEKDKIEDIIVEMNEAIGVKLAEANTNLAKNEQAISQISEKYRLSTKALKNLKEKYLKLDANSKIYEANEKIMKEDLDKAIKSMTEMESKIKTLVTERKVIEKDISMFVEDRGNMLSDLKHFSEDRKAMFSDIKRLIEDRKAMMTDIKKFVEKQKNLNAQLKKITVENNNLRKKLSRNSFREENYEDYIEYPVQDEEDPSVYQDEEYGDDEYDLQVDDAMVYGGEDEDYGLPYSDEEDYMMSGMMGEKKCKTGGKGKGKLMPESVPVSFKPRREILEYYTKESAKRPALKKIKEQVLRSKSLIEAYNIVNDFKSFDGTPIHLREAFKRNSRF